MSISNKTREEKLDYRRKKKELKEKLEEAASEQEDLLVMLSEQEEKMGRMKSRLRELGEVVSDAEEDEEDIT